MNENLARFLGNELSNRIQKNPRYSMRSFAKALGVNIGSLSGILSGKRPVSPKIAKRICDKLGLSPVKQSDFIMSALKDGPATTIKATALSRIEIEEETYKALSEWYHWAILQLVRTEDYRAKLQRSSPRWIARQLQITEIEAKLAIERLIKLNLLKKNQRQFLERPTKNLSTANKAHTSGALRRWQKQVREKAIASLENDPIERRSHTCITMAIDPARIAEAKQMIDAFQEKLSEFLEQGKKEKVYQLCVSLFPLQITEKK